MKYVSILGRQPELGIAELEALFGDRNVARSSLSSAVFDSPNQSDVQRLGGSIKLGEIVFTAAEKSWNDLSKKIVHHYNDLWKSSSQKITLGISVYDWNVPPRDIQKTTLILKQSLKKHSVSLRAIPSSTTALNSATSHHNKLGLSSRKVELIVVRNKDSVIVAESIGAQNITALAARDQDRPKRDAFVGMLPPKLAMMMINLSGINTPGLIPATTRKTILDPFCGTGVLLQEAMLLGFDTYGSDLSEKMIDYSEHNLSWVKAKYHLDTNFRLYQGDATQTTWQHPINAVVAETYLGQPFSAPPRPEKLKEVRGNCNHIIKSFLENLAPQVTAGTPLCLAVPAWRDASGHITHLPLINQLDALGYERTSLKHVSDTDLIYYREDQVVARQLLVMTKK